MPCSRSRSSFSRRMRICSGRSWVTSSVTRPKNTDLANCKSWSAPCKHRVLPIHHRAGRIGKEPDQRLKELRMIKQLAAGFLAVATTGALALSLSAPAQAATTSSAGRATTTAAAHDYWDFSDTWNASSRNYQAKVEGWIKVRGQYDEGNTIKVGGK